MKKALILIVFVFSIFSPLVQEVQAQADADSVLLPGEKKTAIVSEQEASEAQAEDNEYIMAMLDSLVAINFFSNTTFVGMNCKAYHRNHHFK